MLPSTPEHGRAFRIASIFVAFNFAALYKILHDQLFHHSSSPGKIRTLNPPSYFLKTNETVRNDFEIVTTNYGWRSVRPRLWSQRKITKEFYNSVLSHPRFNSTASWTELDLNPDPSRRLVVFMDIDTCLENNYPDYGKNFTENLAIAVEGERWSDVLDKSCVHIKRAAASSALKANKDSRLVILDCGNAPWYRLMDVCGADSNSKINGGGWGDLLDNPQVIIAYYGARKQDVRPMDIGLPAPAVRPIELLPYERHWIETCKSERRHYVFSFQGRGGFRRDRLALLDNGDDVFVRIRNEQTYWGKAGDIWNYGEVMRNSFFAGAPRGDCLYSYRFAEIMSAGTIPVVYADHWLPPFSSPVDPDRIVNWEKCAVFVGENSLLRTIDKLNKIPDDVRCEMQRCSLAFWDEFLSSRDGWLKGILLWINRDPAIAKNVSKK